MANNQNSSNQTSNESTPEQAPNVTVNTSRNEAPANKPNPNMVMALVLCFMLIIGLALAFFFKGQDGGVVDETLTEEKKQNLQRLIAAERAGSSTDSRASTAALEGRISSILTDAGELQSEFATMKAGYTDAQDKLVRAGNEVQGNLNTISRLGSENTALKNQILQLQQLAGNAQAYKNQTQAYAQSNAEKDQVIASLQARPTNDSMKLLRETLTGEELTNTQLVRKIQELELKMLAMAELEDQNVELRRKLQALQTKFDYGKLFVKSHITLPLHAQELYNDLKGLEGFSEEKMVAAYTRIGNDLNAENMQQVKFATGSSILNFTDQTTIKKQLDTTDSTDYFLVVGYASQTGDAASNEKLSANRATAVASVVNQLKKNGQEVRAVYLGQTNRFSKSVNADNQLCEIWRIRL